MAALDDDPRKGEHSMNGVSQYGEIGFPKQASIGRRPMELQAPEKPVSDTNGARRILIVEDNELALQQMQELLMRTTTHRVDIASDAEAALQALEKKRYSILITDLRLPGLDGMDLVRTVHERRLPVTVIVLTGHGSVEEAVQAMHWGAYDFLTKPVDPDNLKLVLQRALRDRDLKDEVALLRAQLESTYSFHDILSKNSRMHAIFELISQIAHTNTTVLIEGETGTGKEQLARAIHFASNRRGGPLVAVNCAALPETLLESELFGHENGAFTGADRQRK